MKNISYTKYIIVLLISNFCNGQITANLSYGIDELLNNSHEYNGKSICLFTNNGAISKNTLTSVEILQREIDLQLVVHLDKKDSVNINLDKYIIKKNHAYLCLHLLISSTNLHQILYTMLTMTYA